MLRVLQRSCFSVGMQASWSEGCAEFPAFLASRSEESFGNYAPQTQGFHEWQLPYGLARASIVIFSQRYFRYDTLIGALSIVTYTLTRAWLFALTSSKHRRKASTADSIETNDYEERFSESENFCVLLLRLFFRPLRRDWDNASPGSNISCSRCRFLFFSFKVFALYGIYRINNRSRTKHVFRPAGSIIYGRALIQRHSLIRGRDGISLGHPKFTCRPRRPYDSVEVSIIFRCFFLPFYFQPRTERMPHAALIFERDDRYRNRQIRRKYSVKLEHAAKSSVLTIDS